MKQVNSYLSHPLVSPVPAIVKGIDKDVEHNEDVLALGLGIVMCSSFFAPIAPPSVLLPAVAVVFAVSSTVAHLNYQRMQQRLMLSLRDLSAFDLAILRPIATVFTEHPPTALVEDYNPLKQMKRTVKSVLGGILINPFWMPIFYVMGVQINAEKKTGTLNKAVMVVERKIGLLGEL